MATILDLSAFLPAHVAEYGEDRAEAEARERFNLVADHENWKRRISSVARKGLTKDAAEREALLFAEATSFFVGESRARAVHEFGTDTWAVVVNSAGYYANIGA